MHNERAILAFSNLISELDLVRPQRGLHDVACDGAKCGVERLFGIESTPSVDAESIVDRYIRGDDLVVSYAATEQRPVSLQLCWRAFNDGSSIGESLQGVDLIVSMQTNLLDSDPTLHVVSDASGSGVITHRCDLPQNVALIGLQDPAAALLLAAHHSDCPRAEINSGDDGAVRISFRLFDPGLEKGVIRRARLRAAFLPRQQVAQRAADCYAAFVSAALPLTT